MFASKFIRLIACLLTCASLPAHAGDVPFVRALHELESGHIEEAKSDLVQIGLSDPTYLDALTELQKIRFKQGDWQAFFGGAFYYRKKFLSAEAGLHSNFRSRILSLEALALAEHCRWEQARTLAQASLDMARALKNSGEAELKDTLDYVELSHAFPKALASRSEPGTPSVLFSSTLFWKIQNQSIASIRHPEILRVKVDNQCGS
jgi:hypothetical protein